MTWFTKQPINCPFRQKQTLFLLSSTVAIGWSSLLLAQGLGLILASILFLLLALLLYWVAYRRGWLTTPAKISGDISENRFRTAMQGANLGFWDSDRRTGQTYRDAFWFDLLGIPESEQGYRHEDWYERVAADQREQVMQTFGSHLLDVGDFVELDYRIRRWDGRYMWVQDRARVLEVDKHGQPARIVGVMQEVTRRKQVELELERARTIATEEIVARDRFMANLSHEIRTPLNAVIGMASLLCDADLPKEELEQVRIIHRSALSLLEMIDKLLDYSRIQAGKIALDVQEFSPAVVVQEVAELFNVQAMEKGLRIGQCIGSEVPQFIEGDAIRVRQVLGNLLSNAIKFSSKGSIEVEARILSEVDLPTKAKEQINLNSPFLQGLHHNYLYIGVKDEGIGIPRYAEKEIFEAFSQLEGQLDNHKNGSGLGLAICSQIVSAMGGAIWVDSIFGQGSHFQFVMRVGVACFLKDTSEQLHDTSLINQRLLFLGFSHADVAVFQSRIESIGLRVRAMANYTSVTDEAIMRNPFALVVNLAEGKGVHSLMRVLSRIPMNAKPERLIAIESTAVNSMRPEEAKLLGFEYVLTDLATFVSKLEDGAK